MKKTFKISILSILTFLAVCGILLFSLPKTFSSSALIVEQNADVEIGSASELVDFINRYSSVNSATTIALTSDITLADSDILTGTIGTQENPFTGTFDGNGHTISNLNFSFTSVTNDVPNHIGLFGVTSGATIRDLQIAGTTTVTVKSSPNTLNLGILAGQTNNRVFTENVNGVSVTRSVQTLVENCIITSNLNYIDNEVSTESVSSGIKTLNMGGYVGDMKNTTIQNSFYRPSGTTSFELDNIYGRYVKIGGIAGAMENSTALFVVSAPNISVQASESYVGTVYLGGIFGTIGQSNSGVINSISEPTFNVVNNSDSTFHIGAVGGYILQSTSEISYVYYNSDNINSGDSTYYTAFANSTDSANGNVVAKVSDTIISHSGGARDYFDSKDWNGLYGDHWDFANIFLIQNNNISLQAFRGEFLVGLSTSSTSVGGNIIEILEENNVVNNEFEVEADYNDEVQITFKFNDEINKQIGQYYRLSNLTLRSGETRSVASFSRRTSESGQDYYILNPLKDFERLSMTYDEEEGIYTLIIAGVTNNYSGQYQLNISANQFVGRFEYHLYSEDDNGNEFEVVEQPKTECYVFNRSGGVQNSPDYTVPDVTYNGNYTVSTQANSRSIYEFKGWYLMTGDEANPANDILLSVPDANEDGTSGDTFSNADLTFTFPTITTAQGEQITLIDDFVIYARYVDNACSLTFLLNEGVERVVISTDANTITETDTTIQVRKQDDFKLELYLNDNYTFDVDTFVEQFNTMTGFCEYAVNSSNSQYFEFYFDLTQLNDPTYEDTLTLNFNGFIAEDEPETDWTLIWIIVGSILGGLALIAVIVIIIVVVRRKKGGGGGGRRKMSYRNMYY